MVVVHGVQQYLLVQQPLGEQQMCLVSDREALETGHQLSAGLRGIEGIGLIGRMHPECAAVELRALRESSKTDDVVQQDASAARQIPRQRDREAIRSREAPRRRAVERHTVIAAQPLQRQRGKVLRFVDAVKLLREDLMKPLVDPVAVVVKILHIACDHKELCHRHPSPAIASSMLRTTGA